MAATAVEPVQGFELKITRVFDAPRELVWKAWTDPAMVRQWMGPRGFRTESFEMGGRPGAPWHMAMEGELTQSRKMARLAQGGTVLEMDPPRLLRMSVRWEPVADLDWPEEHYLENTITVLLEEQGRKTVMTFTQGPFATEGLCDGHNGGWQSAFDKFAEFMRAEQPYREPDPNEVPTELHLQRFFKAPRELVFAAWTKPEMIAAWWGPKGFVSKVDKWEARGGGEIFVRMEGYGGRHPMNGRFVEVYPPYRMHFTAAALDETGKPMFENWNSVFFEEADGGTMVTLDVHVMTQTEVAPQYLKGMSAGWSSSLEKLKEMVEGSK